ncbi:uncharacterized protein LOC101737914 isoform X4 [Bombyx mori]|uniref:Regulatory protein zeste n=1 Tax=Bombyx mori TaxID=7091 RepID=A0A8R2HRU3_BOMMO|nr:uncharacterized protein LOC101737914 isoform X4 [Bombyx mori]
MKTSQNQFDLLVTFMEEHGDLSKPASTPRGRMASIRNWEKLASLLNSHENGNTKTTEKWKKVWSDFKNNTKKKAERLRRKANGADVRPAIYAKLSGLEERVLNVMGMQAAMGSELDGAGSFQVISDIVVSQPWTAAQSGGIELCNVPGPSNRIYTEPCTSSQTQVEPTRRSQAFDLDYDSVEDGVPTSSPESIVTPLSPVQYEPTTQSHRERSLRVRSPSQICARLTQAERAVPVRNSDTDSRAFRIQQHKDYMEIRRERIRIREMELETQKEWQAISLRALDLLSQLANKLCKD